MFWVDGVKFAAPPHPTPFVSVSCALGVFCALSLPPYPPELGVGLCLGNPYFFVFVCFLFLFKFVSGVRFFRYQIHKPALTPLPLVFALKTKTRLSPLFLFMFCVSSMFESLPPPSPPPLKPFFLFFFFFFFFFLTVCFFFVFSYVVFVICLSTLKPTPPLRPLPPFVTLLLFVVFSFSAFYGNRVKHPPPSPCPPLQFWVATRMRRTPRSVSARVPPPPPPPFPCCFSSNPPPLKRTVVFLVPPPFFDTPHPPPPPLRPFLDLGVVCWFFFPPFFFFLFIVNPPLFCPYRTSFLFCSFYVCAFFVDLNVGSGVCFKYTKPSLVFRLGLLVFFGCGH